ncbi:MAG TPA: phosphate transport system regulatory protein PhoU [Deltaproteobacteria bacterium]|jgi:phosphate transport system protein|nr:phosphate transport system regulatory protein PhoU [Deltaproteobacteria bacterium]
MLEQRISELKRELIEFGSHAQHMIEESIKGLMRKDKALLTEVIEQDEPKANEFDIELEKRCTSTIAQFQPKARELRTVLMILKMTADLERMADHAVNIAESAIYLIERPSVKPLLDTPRMAEETVSMVNDSLLAFVNEDATLAKQVCERDNIVDGLANQILRELITYMSSDPSTIERALHILEISGNLERIADLSTNIGEDVIFMVEGKLIKHGA